MSAELGIDDYEDARMRPGDRLQRMHVLNRQEWRDAG